MCQPQMGRSVRGCSDFRPVVRPLALLAFFPQLEQRQHVLGFVNKSPGWRMLQSLFQAGCEPPVMGGSSFTLHQSGAYPQSSKPRSVHAFVEWNTSWREEAASQLGLDDLGSIREGRGGSVCNKEEHTLSNVLSTVSLPADGGHSNVALAERQTLCISPPW